MSVRTGATIALVAAPGDAFDLILAFDRYPEWLSIHVAWPNGTPVAAGVGAGDVLAQRITLAGLTGVVQWTVSQFDPPRTVELTGTGRLGGTAILGFHIRATHGVTQLCASVFLPDLPFRGLLRRAVERAITTAMRTSLENLDRLLVDPTDTA